MKKTNFLFVAAMAVFASLLSLTSCGEPSDGPGDEVFYTVTFDADGGTPTPAAQSVKDGGKATLPAAAPSKADSRFLCWSLDGTTAYDFDTPVTADITLTAQWGDENSHTVTFDADGGSPTPAVQSVADGETATLPAVPPTKADSEFLFWSLDGTTAYDFNTPVTADITLTAQWEDDVVLPSGTRFVDTMVEIWEEEGDRNGDGITETSTETLERKIRYDSQGRVVKVEFVGTVSETGSEDEVYEEAYTFSYGANSLAVSMEEIYSYEDFFEDDVPEPAGGTRAASLRPVKKRLAAVFGRQARFATRTPATRAELQPSDEIKIVYTFTYGLNTDGYIISHDSDDDTMQVYVNGTLYQLPPDEDASSSMSEDIYTYNNGYLATNVYNYSEEYWSHSSSDEEPVKGIRVGEATSTYSWTTGNLTKCEELDEYTNQNGDDEPEQGSYETEAVLEYSDKPNRANVSIDLNATVWSNMEGLGELGLVGKRSANLINKISTRYGDNTEADVVTVAWETDADGYVTGFGIEREYDTYSVTVTYK